MKRMIPVLILVFVAGCSGSDDSQVENINQALTTMLKLEDALASYRIDVSSYPASSDGLSALVKKPNSADVWNGPYLESGLPLDPWGNPYVYEHGAGIYQIVSAGPDGELSSDDDLETRNKVVDDESGDAGTGL
jgi:general secretion pathway protein G